MWFLWRADRRIKCSVAGHGAGQGGWLCTCTYVKTSRPGHANSSGPLVSASSLPPPFLPAQRVRQSLTLYKPTPTHLTCCACLGSAINLLEVVITIVIRLASLGGGPQAHVHMEGKKCRGLYLNILGMNALFL